MIKYDERQLSLPYDLMHNISDVVSRKQTDTKAFNGEHGYTKISRLIPKWRPFPVC